jgi:RNA polymerase sigma factor (sigma-70 family)
MHYARDLVVNLHYNFKYKRLTDDLGQIIKGCVAGKNASREMLYKLYSGKMWAVCLRYAKDYDQAKDILQDGFVKVFDKISQFEGRGHFEGWLRRVIVNTALSEYRKQRHLTFEANNPIPVEEESDDNVECDISAQELMEIIKELPPQYKMVFNLYAIEGYSHKEIAETLNISEGTSKSNLSRARDILKKRIVAQYGNTIKIG